jgi:hypothetical protein
LEENLDYHLRYFKVGKKPDEINYRIRDFSEFSLPDEHYVVKNKYFGFDNGICLPNIHYAIMLREHNLTEFTGKYRSPKLWLQYLFIAKGYSFIHSAAVIFNGKGVIFPGLGGSGKSTIVSELLKCNNIQIFGDDYVIVDRYSTVYSYPSDFCLFDYHLKNLKMSEEKQYFKGIGLKLKFSNFIGGIPLLKRAYGFMQRSKMPEWEPGYVKVPITKLISEKNIGNSAKLDICIFLKKYSGKELKIRYLDQQTASNEINGILHKEIGTDFFFFYLLNAFNVIDIADFEKNQKEIIQECFSRLGMFEILIPADVTPERLTEAIIHLIKDNRNFEPHNDLAY